MAIFSILLSKALAASRFWLVLFLEELVSIFDNCLEEQAYRMEKFRVMVSVDLKLASKARDASISLF